MKQVLMFTILAGLSWGQLGQTGGTVALPIACDASKALALTTQGTVQLAAGVAAKAIYVCGFVVNAGGNTTVSLVQGQGATCSTAQTALTPAFKMNNSANLTFGGAIGPLLKLNVGSTLCVTTSANPDVSVLVVYTVR